MYKIRYIMENLTVELFESLLKKNKFEIIKKYFMNGNINNYEELYIKYKKFLCSKCKFKNKINMIDEILLYFFDNFKCVDKVSDIFDFIYLYELEKSFDYILEYNLDEILNSMIINENDKYNMIYKLTKKKI